METRTLEGEERQRLVERAGCCSCCGFAERELVAWSADGQEPRVHCRECFVQTSAHGEGHKVAYLPEMPMDAFSHYLRALALINFAALTNTLKGHDFSTGELPERFIEGSAWLAPLRWKSLTEGISQTSVRRDARDDLLSARQAYAFLRSRIEIAALKGGDAEKVRLAVGNEVFERDYRILNPILDVDRVRTWGQAGGTFDIVGRRNRLLGRK